MRRVLLALVLLVPFLVAAGHTGSGDEHCTVYTPSTGAVEQCSVEGDVSELMKNPFEAFTGFEPTMQSGPDGDLYYALTDTDGVAIGFGAGVARSTDAGASWQEVSPRFANRRMPPETNDPYVYVDPWTGRVFSFHMAPILTCSILSYSDDKGETWTTNPVGCGPTGVWDHQTIVAAPPTPGTTMAGDYPNVLVQCVNAIYAAVCARSLDGGLTWTHGVPVHFNTDVVSRGCGAQHGHLASEADGTIYLPTSECASNPVVYISRDSGLTWQRSQVSDKEMPFQDPTVAVDGDGTIWVTFQDHAGVLWLTHSTDDGATWSDDVRITPPGTIGTKPAMVAGDGGRIAVAYPGTDDVESFQAIGDLDAAGKRALVWGGFWTVSTNAAAADATFTTIEATGDDPLMRGNACDGGGRCDFQVDFIEATVTPDGQVFASLSDGCVRTCVGNVNSGNDAGSVGHAVAITLPPSALDLCDDTCSRFTGAPSTGEATSAASTAPLRFDPVSSDGTDWAASWFSQAELERLASEAASERVRWAAGRR